MRTIKLQEERWNPELPLVRKRITYTAAVKNSIDDAAANRKLKSAALTISKIGHGERVAAIALQRGQ